MGKAFIMGGIWALIAFGAIGVLVLMVGGRVRIDICGAAGLFVVGGVVGMAVRAVYDKGRRDAGSGGSPRID